ncbi:4F2 cell-surface antigen heavy chain isoform X2 [Triplophysa rosa]|uniref:4F2 cell-surface antigen heavy chain isoform X2 n=1 Tax=Triplophysa rosa TaxID=992332 RepID=UPI002546160A|nr:4F2 cell-surface antigen heavy chain isoform X2 [Triplophysa rosa]
MTLKVEGDPGYGSMSAGCRFTGLDDSETVPLLIPDPELRQHTWKPLNKEELEKCAGGPGWKKIRSCLVLAFWVGWVIMLASAIAVIVQTPRMVTPLLLWWQKDPFYRLQLVVDAENGLSKQLPYLKSLGVGVLILEGLLRKDVSLPNLTQIDRGLGTRPQFRQLMTESRKAGLRIMLDLCEMGPFEPVLSNDTEVRSAGSGYMQDSLRYWLEQGVSGFEFCDTDVTSVKTLMEWGVLMREFSSQDDERILMVRQTGVTLPEVTMSNLVNGSLVKMVTKSLIPPSHHPLSAPEVAEAIETNLQMPQEDWPSWTVGGEVPWELQRTILILIMTLPGTPIIKYGDEINPIQDIYVNVSDGNGDATKQSLDELRRPLALFRSLSQSRAREEALHFGSFIFLPFNTTMSSSTFNATATPPLAFLRSWGCVQFLVVFNLGPEPHAVDPEWAQSLPDSGVFVTSTGLDRLGPVSLQSLKLQPHEAIVIKLFHTDNSS